MYNDCPILSPVSFLLIISQSSNLFFQLPFSGISSFRYLLFQVSPSGLPSVSPSYGFSLQLLSLSGSSFTLCFKVPSSSFSITLLFQVFPSGSSFTLCFKVPLSLSSFRFPFRFQPLVLPSVSPSYGFPVIWFYLSFLSFI